MHNSLPIKGTANSPPASCPPLQPLQPARPVLPDRRRGMGSAAVARRSCSTGLLCALLAVLGQGFSGRLLGAEAQAAPSCSFTTPTGSSISLSALNTPAGSIATTPLGNIRVNPCMKVTLCDAMQVRAPRRRGSRSHSPLHAPRATEVRRQGAG